MPSDVWLTVNRNSVCISNQLDATYVLSFLYNLPNMFRATMCPSSGTDDCVVLSSRVGMWRGCRKVVETVWEVVRPLRSCYVLRMDTLPASRFWQPSYSYDTISTLDYNTHAFVGSWRWTHGCPKHVEQLVKEKLRTTQTWHLVGFLFTLFMA
jgi:hypothetical protein